jgi:hypothetical protein
MTQRPGLGSRDRSPKTEDGTFHVHRLLERASFAHASQGRFHASQHASFGDGSYLH